MKEIDITIFSHNIWGNICETETVSNRNACVATLIDAHDADIIAFQECNPRTSRSGDVDIAKLIAPEYVEVETCFGKNNCTPLFYRASRFSIVNSGFHPYEGLNDGKSKSLTYAVFEDKETGVRFGVISTHFWWMSKSEEDNLQRIENARVLHECAEGLKNKYEIPVFAMGDLNCGYRSDQGTAPYEFLKERLLDTREIAPISTDILTHHDYPTKDSDGIYRIPERKLPIRTLDHIFVTAHPHVAIDSFAVDTSDEAYISSDHFPLILKTRIFGE